MSGPTPGAPSIPERHRPDSTLALRISLSGARGEASFTSGAQIHVTLCQRAQRGEGRRGGGVAHLSPVFISGIFFFASSPLLLTPTDSPG